MKLSRPPQQAPLGLTGQLDGRDDQPKGFQVLFDQVPSSFRVYGLQHVVTCSLQRLPQEATAARLGVHDDGVQVQYPVALIEA